MYEDAPIIEPGPTVVNHTNRQESSSLKGAATFNTLDPTLASNQQVIPRSNTDISLSLGCVYTVVVTGETWRANLCARNRSRDAR
jgi:hypothetical protein